MSPINLSHPVGLLAIPTCVTKLAWLGKVSCLSAITKRVMTHFSASSLKKTQLPRSDVVRSYPFVHAEGLSRRPKVTDRRSLHALDVEIGRVVGCPCLLVRNVEHLFRSYPFVHAEGLSRRPKVTDRRSLHALDVEIGRVVGCPCLLVRNVEHPVGVGIKVLRCVGGDERWRRDLGVLVQIYTPNLGTIGELLLVGGVVPRTIGSLQSAYHGPDVTDGSKE